MAAVGEDGMEVNRNQGLGVCACSSAGAVGTGDSGRLPAGGTGLTGLEI